MKLQSTAVVKGLAYALALLSLAAGIPKLMQMPQELEFLSSIGLSAIAVCMLGLVQLAGGILLAIEKLRVAGAILAGLAFLTSSIAILAGGNTVFGLLSLIPVVLCGIVATRSIARR